MNGTLYLVATPIGNLKDITLRALEILREVDLIACEDTRHTQKLLNHFEIKTKTISYHEHNETARGAQLIERIRNGASIAIVSDAGTPTIADPGFRIVELASEAGIEVISIPGPVAFINAVAASGLPTDSIYFGGFLPSKKSERRKRLEECIDIPATLTFYEAPHRLAKSLADCADVLGDRRAAVARELTKLHEEVVRGTLSRLATRYADTSVKGEIVLIIERGHNDRGDAFTGSSATEKSLEQRFNDLQQQGLDQKTALKTAAKEFGLSKSEAYRRLLQKP
ncbi:MAG TPA: 16S rRNA (cytidine(1402)-2'-O)-methyltransferase [Pyrinomonadaceae bacterium]